jgi:hypothetical protein
MNIKHNSKHNNNNQLIMVGMSATASIDEQRKGFEFDMNLFGQKPIQTKTIHLIVNTVQNWKTNKSFEIFNDDIYKDNKVIIEQLKKVLSEESMIFSSK